MSLAFATLLSDLKQYFKLSDTHRDDIILQFVNEAVEETWEAHDWQDYLKSSRVWTLATETTGTVTATTGSTAVIGVATAFSQSHVGGFFKLDADSHFYEILTVTNSTNLVLKEAYQDTGGAAQDYKIEQGRFDLPDDFARLLEVSSRDQLLFNQSDMNALTWASFTSGDYETGTPTLYTVLPFNSVLKLHLYPVPTSKEAVQILYKRKVTFCAGSGSPDLVDVPTELEKIIRYAAYAKFSLYERDMEAANFNLGLQTRALDKCLRDARKERQLPSRQEIGFGVSNYLTRKPNVGLTAGGDFKLW